MYKKTLLIISLFSLFCGGTTIAGNHISIDTSITISFSLKAREKKILFYNEEEEIIFLNNATHDTVITKSVFTNRPLAIRYGVSYSAGSQMKIIQHEFYLSPGDKVSLATVGKYEITTQYVPVNSVFIDSSLKLFSLENANGLLGKPHIQTIANYDRKLYSIYNQNNKTIDSLAENQIIDKTVREYWHIANEIRYYNLLINAITDKNIKTLSTALKERINLIPSKLRRLQLVKSPEINNLTSNYTQYCLLSANKDPGSILNNVKLTISNSVNYGDLTSVMLKNWIENYPKKNEQDYKASVLLARAYESKMTPQSSPKYVQFKTTSFTAFSDVKLVGFDAKPVTLQQVIETSKQKILFIDLWASWCVPCRQQMPVLEKLKAGFTNKSILFLSISIDTDDKNEDWIKAAKDEKVYQHTGQYRLIAKNDSSFINFFKVETIPRYIVITREGKVLSDRFYTPMEKQFSTELLKLINSNN